MSPIKIIELARAVAVIAGKVISLIEGNIWAKRATAQASPIEHLRGGQKQMRRQGVVAFDNKKVTRNEYKRKSNGEEVTHTTIKIELRKTTVQIGAARRFIKK